MPTYDFRCCNCGYKFTVRVSIKDKGQTRCPICKQMDLVQLFTGINILGASSGSINDCSTGVSGGRSRFT